MATAPACHYHTHCRRCQHTSAPHIFAAPTFVHLYTCHTTHLSHTCTSATHTSATHISTTHLCIYLLRATSMLEHDLVTRYQLGHAYLEPSSQTEHMSNLYSFPRMHSKLFRPPGEPTQAPRWLYKVADSAVCYF